MTAGSDTAGRTPSEHLAAVRLLARAADAANQHDALEAAAAAILSDLRAFTGWTAVRLVPASASGDPVEDGAIMIPVVVGGAGGEVVAVLELVPDGPGEPGGPDDAVEPDDALLDLLAAIGHQLARVAERERAAAALVASEERYQALAASVLDAVIAADGDGRIVTFNVGAERMFGVAAGDVLGTPVGLLVPSWFPEEHAGRTVELPGVRRDGTEFPIEASLSAWVTGAGTFNTAMLRDITERRQAERDREALEHQLAQRALHDPLTSLPNRILLHDRLEQAVARAGRRGSPVTVVAVDLDGFKALNDAFGHHAGDQLLVAVAERLRHELDPDDTLARVGGDEFVVLSEQQEGPQAALRFARRLADAVGHGFTVEGRTLGLTASVGAAVADPGAGAIVAEELQRNAEVAVERAREQGHGHAALYEPSMRTDAGERLAIEHDLRLAIRDGHLRLLYQPVVDLSSGMIDGVEALVRWEHPARGLLAPAQFIGLAEETGLIVPLGRWVLQEACRQAAVWQGGAGRGGGLRISVNVSARQFQQPEWTDEVAQALLRSGLEPQRLALEITESVLMEDTDTTSYRLSELRGLGVRIAIDDFGTGYSSLGYLRRFPVDILKVDKSFIDGVAEGPHESALARAVIKLAATLHLDAVAEGVSSRRQLVVLRRLRCRYGQGYYFARPQPAEVVSDLISQRAVMGGADDEETEDSVAG